MGGGLAAIATALPLVAFGIALAGTGLLLGRIREPVDAVPAPVGA
ncbi:MAG TPA: hypothetical protein VLI93_11630 [Acetobacteraceae bacterium]|nr:hypothetical protein [Acetobacteraceae bacterium]